MSAPPPKKCIVAVADMRCHRSVEEIGPGTVLKLAATSDATSTPRRQMPPQQVMTHLPVSQWQGQGCWERCLGRSQVQGLDGSWITS